MPPRKTLNIDVLRDLASSKGGFCLSKDYIGTRGKYKWKCDKGHEWESLYSVIKRSSWCPECAGVRRRNIADAHDLAAQRNGKFLSEIFTDIRTKYLWECEKGHQWEAKYISVQQGTWCTYCAKTKLSIETLQELASNFNGKCLSTRYVNSKTRYEWQCERGHIWNTLTSVIQSGSWCPECSGVKRLTLEDLHKTAIERGGECLLKDSVFNSDDKINWKCKNGHEFIAKISNVRSGQWCKKCFFDSIKLTLQDLQDFAKSKNGECLSDNYKDTMSKYQWKCAKNHIWFASANSVMNNETWCPICNGNNVVTLDTLKALGKSKNGECLADIYTNNKTKCKWRCGRGHIWEASYHTIAAGHWCPDCINYQTAQTEVYEFIKSITLEEVLYNKAGILPSKGLRFDVYIPSLKKVVELDGKVWHDRPEQIERDIRKNKESEDLSIEILRIDYHKKWAKKNRKIGESEIKDFLGKTACNPQI